MRRIFEFIIQACLIIYTLCAIVVTAFIATAIIEWAFKSVFGK